MLGDIAGTGPLRDALVTTNTLLEQVLRELQETNGQRLEEVASQLRELNAALTRTAA